MYASYTLYLYTIYLRVSPLLSSPLENSFNSVEELLNETRKCAVASIADQTKCSNRLLLPPIADELSPSRDLIRRMKKNDETSLRKRKKKKKRNAFRFDTFPRSGGDSRFKTFRSIPLPLHSLSLPITKLFVDCFLFISARG